MKFLSSLSLIAIALVQSVVLAQGGVPAIAPGGFQPGRDGEQYEICKAANPEKVVRLSSFLKRRYQSPTHVPFSPTIVRRYKI